MATLRYVGHHADIDILAIGECTVRRCGDAGHEWWNLWFRVLRDSDGQPDTFSVPINPNGTFIEAGPGGKTWGFVLASPGAWQVSPSINVLASGDKHPGAHEAPSLWHQTPVVVGVPVGEPWSITP